MFLHGGMTTPSSIHIGRALHHALFGNFVQAMADAAHSVENAWQKDVDAFILGYITHAILDRQTHPYINYFSDWGPRYHMCHPFLERLLDSWALPQVKEDTVALMNLGPDIPGHLQRILASALESIDLGSEHAETQIRGSYQATQSILRLTDAWEPERIKQILNLEEHYGKRRLLALLRPEPLPALDFLNFSAKRWVHPMDDRISSQASFPELFEMGIVSAKKVLENVVQALSAQQVGELVGNEDLDTGMPWTTKPMLHSDPLPLGEAIDSLYSKVNAFA